MHQEVDEYGNAWQEETWQQQPQQPSAYDDAGQFDEGQYDGGEDGYQDGEEALPEGWHAQWDDENGEYYYHQLVRQRHSLTLLRDLFAASHHMRHHHDLGV